MTTPEQQVAALELEVAALKEALRHAQEAATVASIQPYRKKFPRERKGLNHKVVIGGHDVYIIVNFFEDGSPGEIFYRIAKEGSTLYGMLDAFATTLSIAWQWGAPFDSLSDKFVGATFEPCGLTSNQDIPVCSSVLDYTFQWLRRRVGVQPERVSVPG